MKDVYYLKDSEGLVVSKFEVDELRTASIDGKCYEAFSWSLDINDYDSIEYHFVADVYCKWDSCTHWWFKGADYDPITKDEHDSYYHLCGAYSFMGHIRSMCFVWYIVGELLKDIDKYDNYYNETKEINDLIEYMLKDHTIEKRVET